MSDGNPHGTLYTIEWLNKYTSPPGGAPVLLAEVLSSSDSPQAFGHTFGCFTFADKRIGTG